MCGCQQAVKLHTSVYIYQYEKEEAWEEHECHGYTAVVALLPLTLFLMTSLMWSSPSMTLIILLRWSTDFTPSSCSSTSSSNSKNSGPSIFSIANAITYFERPILSNRACTCQVDTQIHVTHVLAKHLACT